MRWLVATQLCLLAAYVAIAAGLEGEVRLILLLVTTSKTVAAWCLSVFVSDRLERGDDHEPTGR